MEVSTNRSTGLSGFVEILHCACTGDCATRMGETSRLFNVEYIPRFGSAFSKAWDSDCSGFIKLYIL